MELFFLALLFIVMMYALGSGYPVAFALPGAAIITITIAGIAGYAATGDSGAFFAQDSPIEWLTAGITNFRGIYWEVERDTLIAIPLFIFMGIMLQRSKIAEDLLVTMAQLFGAIPGGLGISVVFVGALLAATTGIVGATVVAMGLISLPAMLKNNYSKPLATGTICASGTLGQIIPPSIVLIILADQLANAADQAASTRKALYKAATGDFTMPSTLDIVSTSAGDMFLGALLPGLVLVGLYMAYILVTALIKPESAPAVPYDGNRMEAAFIRKVMLALVPPLVLIFVVLGSIIAGVATVNQAGAIGAVGATIMAGYRLREGHKNAYYPAIIAALSLIAIAIIVNVFDINIRIIDSPFDAIGIVLAVIAVIAFLGAVIWSIWRTLKIDDTLNGVMLESAKTTSMVFIILLGAAMLTAAFRAFGGEEIVREFLTALPGGFWTQFIVVMAVIFVLGFFLDFIEIAVVVVPIVSPILLADPSANVTAVWLGVMIGMNIQTSFLTPPFGFALFYLRGVASSVVKTIDIYKGVAPFIALQIFGLVIVGAFPALVNRLPVQNYLTSQNAPPPKNPRLQACLEDYLFTYYLENQSTIEAASKRFSEVDKGRLDEEVKVDLAKITTAANGIFAMVERIRGLESQLETEAVQYRPIHRQVRDIERDIRRHKRHIEKIKLDLRGSDDANEKAEMRQEITELEAEIKAINAKIPAGWKAAHGDYNAIRIALEKERRLYRRGADQTYEALTEAIARLSAADDLAAIMPDIRNLAIRDGDFEAAREDIKKASLGLRNIAATSAIEKSLREASKNLRKDRERPKDARKNITEVINIAEAELQLRQSVGSDLIDEMRRYETAIRNSIGVRMQQKLPNKIVSEIAGCLAKHRDISLNF